MSWTCYFDGACGPRNPGGFAGAGWVAQGPDGTMEHAAFVGYGKGMTNNVAEYHALLSLLKFLVTNKVEEADIRGDSALVVNMSTGRWGRRNPHKDAPHLLPYLDEIRLILRDRPRLTVRWVPREENAQADLRSKQGARLSAGGPNGQSTWTPYPGRAGAKSPIPPDNTTAAECDHHRSKLEFTGDRDEDGETVWYVADCACGRRVHEVHRLAFVCVADAESGDTLSTRE